MLSIINKISSEELQQIVNESKTYGQILKRFGLENKGGNHYTLKRRMKLDNIQMDHIGNFNSGAGWNKGLSGIISKRISKEEALKTIFIKNYHGGKTVRHYVRVYNLIENKCKECGLTNVWNNKPLVLELDHIDGDGHNNELSNLRWLCGNCHSQTKTFRGRKNKKKYYCECGKEIVKRSIKCRSCSASIKNANRKLVSLDGNAPSSQT
jgi:Zn finger protein HypA/HybF involved in hydrogenase expression